MSAIPIIAIEDLMERYVVLLLDAYSRPRV